MKNQTTAIVFAVVLGALGFDAAPASAAPSAPVQVMLTGSMQVPPVIIDPPVTRQYAVTKIKITSKDILTSIAGTYPSATTDGAMLAMTSTGYFEIRDSGFAFLESVDPSVLQIIFEGVPVIQGTQNDVIPEYNDRFWDWVEFTVDFGIDGSLLLEGVKSELDQYSWSRVNRQILVTLLGRGSLGSHSCILAGKVKWKYRA